MRLSLIHIYILFKNLDGKYLTLPECLEVNKTDPDEAGENETEEKASDTEVVDENGNVVSEEKPDSEENAEEEKKEKIIYYVTDEKQQAQYILSLIHI